jgi:hypothetical protein
VDLKFPRDGIHYERVIDHFAKYPQSLIDDFSQKDKAPHIAISVDMLDTGIDVPQIVDEDQTAGPDNRPTCLQPVLSRDPRPLQNGQMIGIKRQETTQQIAFSGMPTLRKSLKR